MSPSYSNPEKILVYLKFCTAEEQWHSIWIWTGRTSFHLYTCETVNICTLGGSYKQQHSTITQDIYKAQTNHYCQTVWMLVMSQCKTRTMVIGQRSWQTWHLRLNSISVYLAILQKGQKESNIKKRKEFYVDLKNVIWCNHQVNIYFHIILNTCESTHLIHYFQKYFDIYFFKVNVICIDYWFINVISFWGVTPHDILLI